MPIQVSLKKEFKVAEHEPNDNRNISSHSKRDGKYHKPSSFVFFFSQMMVISDNYQILTD